MDKVNWAEITMSQPGPTGQSNGEYGERNGGSDVTCTRAKQSYTTIACPNHHFDCPCYTCTRDCAIIACRVASESWIESSTSYNNKPLAAYTLFILDPTEVKTTQRIFFHHDSVISTNFWVLLCQHFRIFGEIITLCIFFQLFSRLL